jgi:hypothetical protein
MRRGEIHVFMTKADEDFFIQYWYDHNVHLLNSWQPKRRKMVRLKSAPPRPEEGDSNLTTAAFATSYRKCPYSLVMLCPDRKPRLRFGDELRRKYHQIDHQDSHVISYYRGVLSKRCVGTGHFLMSTYEGYERKPKYLVQVWNDLRRWLKKNYFALPNSGGFLGPNALELAVRKGQVASSHLYNVKRNKSGKYIVTIDPKGDEVSNNNVLSVDELLARKK